MSELTFKWKGVDAAAYGVEVLRLPDLVSPAIRGAAQTVPGRSGTVFIPEGNGDVYEEIVGMAECYLPYEQGGYVGDLPEIAAWLRGEGWWQQSDLPGRRFKARITDAISFQPLLVGFADRVFGLTVYAQPYRYFIENAALTIASSGNTLENRGNCPSEPRIVIRGSGDITLTINGQRASFEGISGGIIIDSELRDCLRLDGTTLYNSAATDMEDFPLLETGVNTISWTGTVTGVTITPRWRDI